MKICNKCNKEFSTVLRINKKVHNLSSRKYCLECSPFKQHNSLQLEKIQKTSNKCIICEKELRFNQTHYCSKVCKNLQHYNKSSWNKQKLKGIERKKKCIQIKGGCCEICGYNKNIAALVFHHLDPEDKETGLSSRRLITITEEELQIELNKCQLLCSNCHAEIHYPEHKYTD